AYTDYNDILQLTQDMIVYLCDVCLKTRTVAFEDKTLSFEPPFARMQFDEIQLDVTRARFFAVLRNGQLAAGDFSRLVFDRSLERADDGFNFKPVAREKIGRRTGSVDCGVFRRFLCEFLRRRLRGRKRGGQKRDRRYS
ncbi:MAG TPA: hypothetical protein PKM48_06010, partial [Parvularculaceae bacterium]|nr:hypothetical protein [Parvularculaceae bacterium]